MSGRMVLAALVGFFGLVAGVNAIMIYAAISTFGGVRDQELFIAPALHLGTRWRARRRRTRNIEGDRAAASRRYDAVEVTARDAAGRPLPDLAATAALVHPTDRRADHAVPLAGQGAGFFRGQTAAAAGQWDLVIELSRDGERLFRSKNRVWLR